MKLQGKTMGRVLVTGGLGFIGQHLVRSLTAAGYYVIVLDKSLAGRLVSLKRIPKSTYTVIQADICRSDSLRRSLEREKFSMIIHLAAIHHIPYALRYTHETIATNPAGVPRL